MMEITGNPKFKMQIQYQKEKNSPLVDLGEVELGTAIEQITNKIEE